MSDNTELDYEAEHKRLDELERQQLGHDKIMQRIGVAAARYQLDQAVSLAILADGVERLVAHLTGAVPEGDNRGEGDAAPERVWTLATEAEVGDRVVQRTEDGGPAVAQEGVKVAELGTSEGDVWLRLEGSGARQWAKDFVIVEGAEDADEELADRIEAEEPFIPGGVDEDDDFAPPAADGFAALKGAKGKGKKK